MQMHNLKPRTRLRKSRRIGRGGKRGTTSGRGTKGQRSRAGHKIRPAIRDIIKKMPKLRGYKFKSFRIRPAVVNLKDLDKHFQAGETVSPKTLLQKGLVRKHKGRTPEIKIIGGAETNKKFVFKDVALSKGVEAKVH